LSAFNFPKRARSKRGGACCASIPRRRSYAHRLRSKIAIEGIVALLRGQLADFSDVTLDMHGVTPFSRRVYELARAIPRGETKTFAEVARRLGASGASHAVGLAITRNPFTILVPCHRVLPAAGRQLRQWRRHHQAPPDFARRRVRQ
jgi:methylated-DNA-[protein]-cysteine S-methyltransferase